MTADVFAGAHEHPTPAAVDAATGAREALMRRMAAIVAELARDLWGWKDARAVEALEIQRDADVDDFDYTVALDELGLSRDDAASPDASGTPPSASPEASQSPSRAAQDTADGRVWRLFVRGDGSVYGFPVGLGPGSFEALDSLVPVVPQSELARVQRERDDLLVGMQNVADAHSPNADHSAYMLQRAQYYLSGKRDAIESHFAGYRAELDYQKTENATLRAELAAANNRVDVAYQQRDAALDRARVAEQRIEQGVECWQDREGHLWAQLPSSMTVAFFGPFTRGRFVADTEDGHERS